MRVLCTIIGLEILSSNQFKMNKHVNLLKSIGPGILLAGAAIGVSHLVQATRAGADYGFSLFWILLIAIVSKYPFLEFGPRYTAATGYHLIDGYRKLGKSYLFVFVGITIGTMFIIQASVTLVTAGLAEHLFGLGWSPAIWSFALLIFCAVLLLVGRYPGLDLTMKIIISVLALCTFVAVLLAIGSESARESLHQPAPSYWNVAGLAFIIAFMGWMPIPLDVAVWHSIWSLERSRQTGYRPTPAEARFDFNLGYISAGVIGVLFFLLGVLVMYGTGKSFSQSSLVFSAQLIEMYSNTLGSWSTPLLSVAALITMFSTTLAVTDAYPRVITELWKAVRKDRYSTTLRSSDYTTEASILDSNQQKYFYFGGMICVTGVALLIIHYLSGSFTTLIDVAAGLSFLAAPILAWFNYRLVTGKIMPERAQPSLYYRIFSVLCLLFLVLFSIVYLYWRFWLG